jgi:7-cyano-7-deazaguanine synthase
MSKDLAVVLCDGGLNSAVAATLAAQRHRLILLSADPGGGTGSRRRAAYDMLVGHLKPFREHSLAMPYLQWVKRSNPSGGVDPRASTDVGPRLIELAPLIGIAARFAAHHAATAIYLGLRIGPLGTELTRATEYMQVWNELLQLPCGLPDLELNMPLLELDLWQVVDLGIQVGCPMDKTWSCDQDTADPCFVCPGCRTREAAFEQAAKPDPLRRRA